jgi:uncharacterized protein (TIGR03089 family)
MVSTPYELLRTELQRDGSRPLLTFYDDATGERVELSVTTFDNWVAKTAGLLRDDLAADSGHRAALQLPPHWQALVWAQACWALGVCVTSSAYNAGMGNVDRWVTDAGGEGEFDHAEDIPFPETRAYVANVQERRGEYREHYADDLGL